MASVGKTSVFSAASGLSFDASSFTPLTDEM